MQTTLTPVKPASIDGAAVVLPCADLSGTVDFFTEMLGFRLEMISPADDPSVAEVAGYGLRARLVRGAEGSPGVLRLSCSRRSEARTLQAPNGTRIEIVAEPALELPPLRPTFVVSRMQDAHWIEGRAGMRYRDLIPNRLGGRYIASHIQIPDGGPVPDYVHHHRVRFQAIHVHRGWVEVVYQDQGPPITLHPGDCVLQPPGIRHRVVSCSPGLEVVEIACPAAHSTFVDHELALPTRIAERDFEGQRFVHHVAVAAPWVEASSGELRDTGIAAATGGIADIRSLRRPAAGRVQRHQGELLLGFVSAGTVTIDCEGHGRTTLRAGDAIVVPPGPEYTLLEPSDDLELLEITSPAATGPQSD